MPLTVLPPESPCAGCLHNCCDPMVFIHPEPLMVPIQIQNPQFPWPFNHHYAAAVAEIGQRVQYALGLAQDGRFSLRGILLKPDQHDEDHGMTYTSWQIQIGGGRLHRVQVTLMRATVQVLLTCSAFDAAHGVPPRSSGRTQES